MSITNKLFDQLIPSSKSGGEISAYLSKSENQNFLLFANNRTVLEELNQQLFKLIGKRLTIYDSTTPKYLRTRYGNTGERIVDPAMPEFHTSIDKETLQEICIKLKLTFKDLIHELTNLGAILKEEGGVNKKFKYTVQSVVDTNQASSLDKLPNQSIVRPNINDKTSGTTLEKEKQSQPKLETPLTNTIIISPSITDTTEQLKDAIKSGSGSQVVTLCHALTSTKQFIIDEELITLAMECFKFSSEKDKTPVFAVMNAVVATGGKVTVKTLETALNQAYTSNDYLIPVINAIKKTHGQLNENILKLAIKSGNHNFVLAICQSLKESKQPRINEDLIKLAMEQFKFSSEKDIAPVLAVIDAVIGTGGKVTVKTLEIAIQHPYASDKYLMPILDAIKQTNEEMTAGILKLAIQKKNATYVINISQNLVVQKQPVIDESFLQLVLQNFKFSSDKDIAVILAVIRTIIVTNGQITSKIVPDVLNHYAKDKLIDPLLDAIFMTDKKSLANTLSDLLKNRDANPISREKIFHAYFKKGGDLTDDIRKLAAQNGVKNIEAMEKEIAKQKVKSFANIINIMRRIEGPFKPLPVKVLKHIVHVAGNKNRSITWEENQKIISEQLPSSTPRPKR